jgi:uncharacterized protein (TIGR00730 family)
MISQEALAEFLRHERKNYRVTIFGSSRIEKDNPLYQEVQQFALDLTKMGCDIVTGGGPGLMAAANEGSVLGDPQDQTQSIGIRVDLDFEQHTNPFVEKVYHHHTFFSRLYHFALIADAFVVVPGGIGTTLEFLMIWQLLQVKKLHDTPLIMVGKMWSELRYWATEYMVNTPYQLATIQDIKIPICVNDFQEAKNVLKKYHEQWQQDKDQKTS